MDQPMLFKTDSAADEIENLVLYALGDFRARGKVLADRELPLDRLRGAFKRAAAKFGNTEPSDDKLAETLEKFGAKVVKVPSFVAKHPYRVTVGTDLAAKAEEFFSNSNKQ